jgi:uncharacterized membrane protein YidH (DUF202 family)
MVKFGRYLKENAVEEWRDHYMNYNAMKTLVAAFELSAIPSEKDQLFFRARVLEDAQNVERWFKRVRDDCMGRLYVIKGTLPESVQATLRTRDEHKSSSIDESGDGGAVADEFSSSSEGVSTEEDDAGRTAVDGVAHLDDDALVGGGDDAAEDETGARRTPSTRKSVEVSDGYLASGDDCKDTVDSTKRIKMYLGESLYTHIPPSAHVECLQMLQIMAKLKLFAWQNAEAFRKTVKKFDKRCNCNLTLSFWPQIQKFEFAQEKKMNAYISECASVLTTRVIPFENFSVEELKLKGVDLAAMSRAIQQLETVCDLDLPEVVPMSVEPRSYMANERTFLKWMRMGALTAFLGMVLLSFKHEPVTGIVLMLFSVLVVIRSFHEYRRRTESLVDRVDHNWDDAFGAKLMLISLLLPMCTYLVYLILFGINNNRFGQHLGGKSGLGAAGAVGSL